MRFASEEAGWASSSPFPGRRHHHTPTPTAIGTSTRKANAEQFMASLMPSAKMQAFWLGSIGGSLIASDYQVQLSIAKSGAERACRSWFEGLSARKRWGPTASAWLKSLPASRMRHRAGSC